MDRKVVIIPTYNEKENIEKIIRAVFGLDGDYHILVIEDGSPDGTAAIVKRLQEEFPMIPHEADDAFSYELEHLLLVWLILVVFIVVPIVIGNFGLHRVKHDNRD